jgi:CBS domain containing-hemolysin-like protein
LIATFSSTVCLTTFFKLGKFKSNELLKSPDVLFPFIRSLLKPLFPHQIWENLYFFLSLSKSIGQMAYAILAFFFVIENTHWLSPIWNENGSELVITGLLIITLAMMTDFLAKIFTHAWTLLFFKASAPIASIYLILCFPITAPLLKLSKLLFKTIPLDEKPSPEKNKIREMIKESDLHHHLDIADQKLIASLVNFKERVAKEIMVPRVDIYALPSDTTLEQAALFFASEGYSRIPLYQQSLDRIVGVVLYKDLLKHYTSKDLPLNTPIEKISKPVLYSPENKKITQLLQEFRNKQIHMAIIVDEYGGTEGIVTIEDILEELVGEIEDEYDIGAEHNFLEIPGGGWIVDAKMTIFTIEEKLGIKIPQNPEYETIGGYIYHYAGTIPPKGWHLSHDDFELEVISSNERSIKKIKIQPRAKHSPGH